MPGAMTQSQANEATARVRIHQRRAFPHQIGKKHELFASWRNSGRELVHFGVGNPFSAKNIAQPPERHPGRKHRSQYIPARFVGMTKGVQPKAGIKQRLSKREKNLATGPDRDRTYWRVYETIRNRLSWLI